MVGIIVCLDKVERERVGEPGVGHAVRTDLCLTALRRSEPDRVERLVEPHEVGRPLDQICTGQAVRVIRDGRPYAVRDPAVKEAKKGDYILEIIDSV